MGGLWTERKKLGCDRERLHSCRQMFPSDDVNVIGDRLALPVSLREVIAARNRLRGGRREVIVSRAACARRSDSSDAAWFPRVLSSTLNDWRSSAFDLVALFSRRRWLSVAR